MGSPDIKALLREAMDHLNDPSRYWGCDKASDFERRVNAALATPTPPAPADVGDDDPACTCAPLGRSSCIKHAPTSDVPRPYGATPAPADDAGGAEAMREACAKLCDEVAAEDLADEREADEAGDDQVSAMARESVRTATYLAETIRALPLPARDDAVEEAMAPGCHEHVALWDAINAYSAACGGHPTRGGGARMDAVVRVEKALRAALRREKESRSDDSRPASGQGGA